MDKITTSVCVERFNHTTGQIMKEVVNMPEGYDLPQTKKEICQCVLKRVSRLKRSIRVFTNANSVTVIMMSKRDIRIGQSKCKKSEKFDITFGKCLAICRAMKWEQLEKELLAADAIESVVFKKE